MRLPLDPFRLLLISLAGWMSQQQQDVIDLGGIELATQD